MIVYRVGDGFQDAHGREVTEDGRLLSPDMPPPVNQAALDAMHEDAAAETAAEAERDAEAVRKRAAARKAKEPEAEPPKAKKHARKR